MIENCQQPITAFTENPVNVYMGNLLFFFMGVITTYVLTSLSNGFRTEDDYKLRAENILEEFGLDKEKVLKLFEFVNSNIDSLNDRLENTRDNETGDNDISGSDLNNLFLGNSYEHDLFFEKRDRKKVKLDNDDVENEEQGDEMLESIFEEASNTKKTNEKKSNIIELPELENVDELEKYTAKLSEEQKKNLEKIAELYRVKQNYDNINAPPKRQFNIKSRGRYATNAEISQHSKGNKGETGKGENDYKVVDARTYLKEPDNSEDKVEIQEGGWGIFS